MWMIWSAARLDSLAAGAEADSAGAEAPGSVDAGGADEAVAPPQAATTMATLARMPNSRFCMNCPPNGCEPDINRYRGSDPACDRPDHSLNFRSKPPARSGPGASDSGSTVRVGALRVLSTAPHPLS